MRTLIRPVVLVLAAGITLSGFGHAQEKKPADPPKKQTVMQRKLAHAHRVLEGLALNDFERISMHTDELMLCAQEASWRVVKTQKYDLYSNDFVRSLQNLKKAAKNKNTDAAALAYVEVALNCVKCHQYIRDEGVGAAPDLSPLGPRTIAVR